jgi:hypothetical protein
MSAAEPANPNPRVLTTPDGAAVIDISKRTTHRKAAAAARGRWQAMNQHQPPDAGPDPQRTLAEQFADEMEASFNSIGRTLTDPDTAEGYTHTLRLVERILEGADAQDIISEEQRHKLAGMVEGMRSAPGLL